MLRFWYPGAERRIDSLEQLREALDLLLLKYDVQFVGPVGRRYLAEYMVARPVAVFALACHYQWEASARQAARECLKLSHEELIDNDAAVFLGLIFADIYQSLLLYHKQCGEAAASADNDAVSGPPAFSWETCKQCHITPGSGRKQWISDFVVKLAEKLKDRPILALADVTLLAAPMQYIANCRGNCRLAGYNELPLLFGFSLPHSLTSALDKVELKLNFKD
ncbi:hypothetical protein B0H17DRAFT_980812 [Mycena rosella]|uniref:Uncharacterized protein n=1 Tax=Mycena rosella TaxID=1033263 RepID=A0AAD7GM87_MYCRO|nr:hypothetical protein B0H17DRAFT_980812 [Mycena rosella]